MALKIGVLMGGRSAEREISLLTGEAVYNALRSKGYSCVKIDVDEGVAGRIIKEKINLAFLALHGEFGEDGAIQGLLEIIGVPYTGSGILASAAAMDKVAAKRMLASEGLPTPDYILIEQERESPGDAVPAERIVSKLGLPVVIKPPRQGSSIGMSIVRREEQLTPALELAFRYDSGVVLAEKFIEGKEIHAAVLGNNKPVPLPLIEVVSATGIYDYEAKYTAGMSSHIIPPQLPEEQQTMLQEVAVRAFKALGCRGLARVDLLIDRQGNPYILELNTIPGMTATSLCPDAAQAAGMEFPDLVERMVRLALNEEVGGTE